MNGEHAGASAEPLDARTSVAAPRYPVTDSLQFANTVMATTLEASPDAILVVDENARIISFNRRFGEMWGLEVEILATGDDAPVLKAVTSAMKDPEGFVDRVRYLYAHPEVVETEEIETRDGRTIERHTAVMRTGAGSYLGRVWFFRDVSSRKRAEAEIRRAALVDMLTELPNRKVLWEAIGAALSHLEGGEGAFALLFVDLDHFKDVNDTLGHSVGDELLRTIADRLRQSVREGDIVARFGGDEFVVLAAGVGDAADAAAMARKLVETVGAPMTISGTVLRCGASVGVTLCSSGAADAELLLSQADLALYQAKSNGRAGYSIYTQSMGTEAKEHVALIADLERAIASSELTLEYQPQFDARSGHVVGAEALVRWNHPKRGVLSLRDIIHPDAREEDLLVSVDRWAMEEVGRHAKVRWEDRVSPAVISMNISAAELKRPLDMERDITRAIEMSGLPPQQLEIGIAESILMDPSRELAETFAGLRRRGVRLAVDDFGAGHCCLDYLLRYPTHRLKIAPRQIGQIVSDRGAAALVQAVVALANELGIGCVAQGVETAKQFALLRRWGCPQMQGAYFCGPLSADRFAELLRCDGSKVLAPHPRSAA